MRRVITRLMLSLFKTNLKLKIAAMASTYLREEAGQQETGIILVEDTHNKFSNVSVLNMLLGDYEVVLVTCAMYLVLSTKCELNLFLFGT